MFTYSLYFIDKQFQIAYNKHHDKNEIRRGAQWYLASTYQSFFRTQKPAGVRRNKKRDLYFPAIIPFTKREIIMNKPMKKHLKQNFKNPPHFFESTRGPPEL